MVYFENFPLSFIPGNPGDAVEISPENLPSDTGIPSGTLVTTSSLQQALSETLLKSQLVPGAGVTITSSGAYLVVASNIAGAVGTQGDILVFGPSNSMVDSGKTLSDFVTTSSLASDLQAYLTPQDIVPGNNITVTSSSGQLTINATGASTISGSPSDILVFNDSGLPSDSGKTLADLVTTSSLAIELEGYLTPGGVLPGANITVTSSGSQITISGPTPATGAPSDIAVFGAGGQLSDSGRTLSEYVTTSSLALEMGGVLYDSDLVPGNNITITSSGSKLTIASTAASTLSGTPSDVVVFDTSGLPSDSGQKLSQYVTTSSLASELTDYLTTTDLVPGANVSITSSGSSLIISASGGSGTTVSGTPYDIVTFDSAGFLSDSGKQLSQYVTTSSLASDLAEYPAYADFLPGTNISITSSAGQLTFNSTAASTVSGTPFDIVTFTSSDVPGDSGIQLSPSGSASGIRSSVNAKYVSPQLDFKTAGSSPIFTVPAGYNFIFGFIRFLLYAITTPGTAPTFDVGTTATPNLYAGPVTLSTTTPGQSLSVMQASPMAPPGTVVNYTIVTASTAASETGYIIVEGTLVPI